MRYVMKAQMRALQQYQQSSETESSSPSNSSAGHGNAAGNNTFLNIILQNRYNTSQAYNNVIVRDD